MWSSVTHENSYRLRFNSHHTHLLKRSFTLTAFPSNLAEAAVGNNFTVTRVVAPAASPEWASQLQDIGFFAGEHVAIMARGLPGGDPLVVRVGLSTFALRLVEAACIQVVPNATAHQ